MDLSSSEEASEMAQEGKMLAAKTEDLSLTPRTQMVEGENQFLHATPTHRP